MKKFLDKLVDILYDYMDYVLMLIIVVSIVGVIGWRLDILFTKDVSKLETNSSTNLEEKNSSQEKKNPITDVSKPNGSKTQKKNNIDENSNEANEKNDANQDENKDKIPDENNGEIITVVIPDGSTSLSIGEILESNGLVDNQKEFIQKSEELNLDRKLKSGTFEIPKNSSLESLVKIIAKEI